MEESTWLHLLCCGAGITILGAGAGSACGEGGRERRGAGSPFFVTRLCLVAALRSQGKGGTAGSRDGGHGPAAAGPGAGSWQGGKVWVSMADTGEALSVCDLPAVCVRGREKGLLCLCGHGGS